MAKIEITPDWIRNVIRNKHLNYDLTVKLAKRLTTHASGIVPEDLIYKRRPSEPEEIKEYRKQIYVPITKNPISKVITSLQKIRRSQDWSIQYQSNIPSIIADGESLEDYCEKNYPGFASITNWVFSELLQRYLLDANSFVAVIIKDLPTSTSEYLKPVAEVFSSQQVIDYVEDEYLVLKSADKVKYTSKSGYRTYYDGDIYYILTEDHIIRYKQVSRNGDLDIDLVYDHGIGRIPAFRVGGNFHKRVNNDTLYESRIDSMVPSLDEAAREYSDLQAEIVQHIHSEKYIYTNTECPHCKGTGLDSNTRESCTHCNGAGHIKSVSPYGEYIIRAQSVGENAMPTPPIGYINKSSDIAKLQDERVENHIYRALASINMEFLAETPLNQSGTAKEVDKDELNNFVNSIAEDLVRIMDNIYYFIGEYRYIYVLSKDDRKSMMPKIYVPEKFDILDSSYLMLEIQAAKTSKVNSALIKDMEIEYARKKYNADESIAEKIIMIYNLDPLYGYTIDEKMTILNNDGVTTRDYVVSCNIMSFVNKAMNRDQDFVKLDFDKQMEALYQLADEVISVNSAKSSIRKSLGYGEDR